VLLAGVAGGIAFPVIPLLGVRVGLPLWFIGTILAANRAGRIVSAPIVGVLTDRWGGRRMVILGLASQVVVMALYLVGVVGGNPGLYFLLARLLHGPASACVFVGAQTLALHAGGPSHGGLAAGMVRACLWDWPSGDCSRRLPASGRFLKQRWPWWGWARYLRF
jgi:MFS family permease